MKISIITACRNAEATIQKTIDSVAGQTWPSIEHIVIDGASTDLTVFLLQKNKTKLAHCISEPDNGVYQAMNKGLALSTGDIVAFLNADDLYSNARVLETVANTMQEQNLDALYGDVEFFHASNSAKVVRIYNSGHFNPSRIAWGWMPAHPALFVRRSIYDRFGFFKEDYRIAGDYEWVARIFKNGQINSRHLASVLVRMQTGGLSTSGLRASYLLNREIIRACRQNGIETNWLMILSKYFYKVRELFHA